MPRPLRLHNGSSPDLLGVFALLGVLGVLALLTACGPPSAPGSGTVPEPPASPKGEVVDVLHGVEIADPYRWLEDPKSPETRAWIDAQNAYTDTVLAAAPDREALAARFTQLMKIDTVGFPVVAGERYFFSKRSAEQQLGVLYLRQGLNGEDEVLLDPHPLSDDHTTSINLLSVDADGRLLAYAVREGGEDEVTPRLFDVDRRQDLADRFPKGRYYGLSLTPDGRQLYYTRLEAGGPRLYRHTVGGEGDDTMIFGEGIDPAKLLFANLSEDGRHLLAIVSHGSAAPRVDVYLQRLESGGDFVTGDFVTVVEGVDATFRVDVVGDLLVARTDHQAANGRVMVGDVAKPQLEHWRELVAEREGAVLRSLTAVGGRLFANYLEDVRSRVLAFDLDGEELGEIAFDTLGTVSSVGGRWDSSEAFFAFTSFHVPTTIYRYDVESGERQVWSQSEVPIDAGAIEVRQVWYPSKDGTQVPMFLAHQKGLELDGERPVYLTGYGGFRSNRTPSFSESAVVWVEQGGVYALPSLRGGGELGEEWHRGGMLENKQNVFDDFIAAAEWLIANGYTRPEKLAIAGGSNGGLLVGAAATQRPDLFGAVICYYPLLDMVRYHRFMVASYWVPEYGSAEDPEQFTYLRAYSPYHNVEPGTAYPAMLFVTGDADTRVAPLHARKMAALMQASGSPRPVLLRYHTKAGHSGGTPLAEEIANSAESFSFLLWQLGEPFEPRMQDLPAS